MQLFQKAADHRASGAGPDAVEAVRKVVGRYRDVGAEGDRCIAWPTAFCVSSIAAHTTIWQ